MPKAVRTPHASSEPPLRAFVGTEARPQCTLSYAAPEVILGFDEKRNVTAEPAQDIWALGVMVFEAFTRQAAVDPLCGVGGCTALARGDKLYPWEAQDQENEFGGSRARKLVESCLARDPEQRPTAQTLVESIRLIGNRTQWARRTVADRTLRPEVSVFTGSSHGVEDSEDMRGPATSLLSRRDS